MMRSSFSPQFTRVFGISSIIAIARSTDQTRFFLEAEAAAVTPIPASTTKTEFRALIDACLAEAGAGVTGECTTWGASVNTTSLANGYGSMPNWNTSLVTDMTAAFEVVRLSGSRINVNFNGNILSWDTSSVTDMVVMFSGCTAFNQPIGNWTTSSVTDMTYMFFNAAAFDQDISTWTGSAYGGANTTQDNMFLGAHAFQAKYGSFCANNITGPADTCKLPPSSPPPPSPPLSPPPSSSSRSPRYTKAVALVGFLSAIAPMLWF